MKNIRVKFYIALLGGLIASASCNKPSDSGPISSMDTGCQSIKQFSNGVLVINEGNYGWGAGSLTWKANGHNPYTDIFKCVNGRVAGNVCQSLFVMQQTGYLVVNNSQKIEVLNMNALQVVEQITGLHAPRYMLSPDGLKAYITDLYDNSVAIVSLATNKVTGKIGASGWTNKMVNLNGLVYITQQKIQSDGRKGLNNILVLDPKTDRLIDSIPVGEGLGEVVTDNQQFIWTLTGKHLAEGKPALVRINPTTRQQDYVKLLPAGIEQRAMVPDLDSGYIYFICGDVYRQNTSKPNLEPEILIHRKGHLFYGLGSGYDGHIYVSDAKDYVKPGTVYIYSRSGILKDSFSAGVIPNSFQFLK